jgi:(2Fe-2S) ferredoxin
MDTEMEKDNKKGRLKSLAELRALRENAAKDTGIRTTGENPDRTVIAVGMATCGIAAGARLVLQELTDAIAKEKLENVAVISTGCPGFCYAEPMVEVRESGKKPVWYQKVDASTAKDIVKEHVLGGKILDKAVFRKDEPTNE